MPTSFPSAATILSSTWRPSERIEPEADRAHSPGPAFGRVVLDMAEHGRAVRREVSLCGDLAGDPAQVAALLDQGLRIFSVAPGALGPVKAAISVPSAPG